MPSYLSFARFYDGLMQDACYEKRCDYILKLAESFGHDMGITLDLACGTGTLTRLLKKRGVDVFGIDYSMEMLSEAMQSASEEGLDILFLRQKMQSIDLYGTINTCVCTLDSINHLTKIEDVAKTFDRVGLFMDDDGLFIFDVNTVYKHKNVLADNTFVYENDIANARKYYNAVVRQYNNKIEMFPSNIVANMFKYSKKTMFAVDDTNQRQNVKVEF